MTTVIGLDLSLTATGIAYPDGTTATIKTRTAAGDLRLLHIQQTIADALHPDPHLVVLEDLPTHAHSAGITGMVHGAVRAVLLAHQVPYALIAPATLKAYATGSGSSGKSGMVLAAFKRAGVEFEREDDNQCDAWWLRAAGLDRLGEPLFPLPQAQRDRLDKAKWPILLTGVA